MGSTNWEKLLITMDCLLVFNHLNDLVYKKYNQKFENHILELALSQGLIQVSLFTIYLNIICY